MEKSNLKISVPFTPLRWPVSTTLVLWVLLYTVVAYTRRNGNRNTGTRSNALNFFMNTHNSPFSKVGCHDDDVGVIVPHHSPEVFDCRFHRSLCRYVLPGGPLITLQSHTQCYFAACNKRHWAYSDVIGIDVIRVCSLPRQQREVNPRLWSCR